MANEKMVKLGTFNEYTPNGNSFDASDENLTYNVEEDKNQDLEKEEKEEG